jgi:hypothetical protein
MSVWFSGWLTDPDTSIEVHSAAGRWDDFASLLAHSRRVCMAYRNFGLVHPVLESACSPPPERGQPRNALTAEVNRAGSSIHGKCPVSVTVSRRPPIPQSSPRKSIGGNILIAAGPRQGSCHDAYRTPFLAGTYQTIDVEQLQ